MQALATELAGHPGGPIRVNGVAPGIVATKVRML